MKRIFTVMLTLIINSCIYSSDFKNTIINNNSSNNVTNNVTTESYTTFDEVQNKKILYLLDTLEDYLSKGMLFDLKLCILFDSTKHESKVVEFYESDCFKKFQVLSNLLSELESKQFIAMLNMWNSTLKLVRSRIIADKKFSQMYNIFVFLLDYSKNKFLVSNSDLTDFMNYNYKEINQVFNKFDNFYKNAFANMFFSSHKNLPSNEANALNINYKTDSFGFDAYYNPAHMNSYCIDILFDLPILSFCLHIDIDCNGITNYYNITATDEDEIITFN